MRRRLVPAARLALAFLLLAAGTAPAQEAAPQRPTPPADAPEARPAPIGPADYGRWETLGAAVLSPDGRWIAYAVSRQNGQNELRVREVAGDSTRAVAFGVRPAFSADGRWLAYGIGRSEEEREKLEKAKKPVRDRLGLLELGTGETRVVENVASFSFSPDGRYLAMRGYPVEDQDHGGVDLVVRDLARGVDTNFGNVSGHAWQDEGHLLALTVDAAHRAGNGVQLYDPAAGTLRTLDSGDAFYTGLAWRDGADDLAVLRTRVDSLYEDTAHVVLAWRGLEGRSPARMTFDPATAQGFPAEHRVVDYRPLAWSDDGATLFFGIQERHRKPGAEKVEENAPDPVAAKASADTAAGKDAGGKPGGAPEGAPRPQEGEKPAGADKEEEPAGVEVWHAGDIEIIPEQKVRADRDRRENYLAAWHLGPDRFVQLGDELTEDVVLAADGQKAAIGLDGTPYDRERMFGPVYRDLYRIDVATGERAKLVERVQYQYGPSPGGRYLLYLEDDHYWTVDLRTGARTNITKDVPTAFVDHEDDHTVKQKPPFGVAGWTRGDRSVLLHDRYDLWEVRPDGSKATRLTDGARDSVRHRLVRLDREEHTVDTAEPLYLSLYGEWSKKSGYARLRPGRAPERLLFEDRRIGRLAKADSAQAYAYTVEAFDDSPDYLVGGAGLAGARQVTATNPFQADFAWGRAELIEYTNKGGRRLQGALFYPADYEPGRKYPLLVYIYEITSGTLHSYSVPSERSAYNPAVFTSQGYFVLRPDIVYRDRDPGVSAVEALVPAVEKVLETGMVDPARVGLVGHSWGGYQTAFVVTQTDLFSAAVAGAPLTDLISMYLSIYWNTGGTDARIFEISQGRMEVPFWEDLEAYMRNSPLFNIRQMNTPLLVAFGDKDGAVDWHQRIELYNAARRAGKDMVMLVYEGENHGLRRKPNQIDYHRRILEWFGHYLKGHDAPKWITDGVSHLERERELERAKEANKNGGG